MDPRRPACPALVPDQEGRAGKGEQNEAACREAPASTTRNGARRLSEAIRGNAAPRDGLFVGRGAGGPLSPSCLSFAVIFLPREVLIPLNYGFFFFFFFYPGPSQEPLGKSKRQRVRRGHAWPLALLWLPSPWE